MPKAALSRLYFTLSPVARRVLPKSVLRFLLLHVLDVNRPYREILGNPGRLFMERDLLPWLRQNYSRILFVGTASYAWHYEKLFRQDPEQYTTLDSQPGAAVWGAPTHIVARIEDIGRHRPGEFFDCIVFNGVFGFGIDSPDDMRRAVKAMHDALRPGGLLIV
ncbi:MAG: class I SAM-dependent methyltransferase, partial [Reyranellales bacterium]